MGIDKGSTNENVIYFDSVYGVHYPGVSGQEGGGNQVHLTYEIQATPSIVVITPDHVIAVKQIFPPTTAKVVDSVMNAGGLLQNCMTGITEMKQEESFSLAPNPAGSRTDVQIKLTTRKELEIRIFDARGLMIRQLPPTIYAEGKHSIILKLEGLSEGLYFVRVMDEKQVVMTKKLVVSYKY